MATEQIKAERSKKISSALSTIKQDYSPECLEMASTFDYVTDAVGQLIDAGYLTSQPVPAKPEGAEAVLNQCRNKLIDSGAQAIPKSCRRCGLNKFCADTALPQRTGDRAEGDGLAGRVETPDYSDMSREALERHAARMAQALADDRPRKFYDKYATGPMLAPSCLYCGKLPNKVAIRHLELPGIVVCEACVAPPAASELPALTDDEKSTLILNAAQYADNAAEASPIELTNAQVNALTFDFIIAALKARKP